MPRSDSTKNRGKPIEERFWQKVGNTDDCWEWIGARNPSGHGRIGIGGRKQSPAHRVAYEMYVGPIPEGLHLDHLCQRPWCVNPWHLEPVSLWENLRRAPGQVAVVNAAKTHCKRDHEFTPENTYSPPGRAVRVCRACMRDRYLEKKAG